MKFPFIFAPYDKIKRMRKSQGEQDVLLANAADLASAAQGHAQASDWATALSEMQQAVTQCERAMRLIGIGY